MARILCVEDEEDLRQDIVEELEDAGYEVMEAGNGQQALEQILIDAPDLVVSDITMPVMDGYELVKRLRTEHSKYDDMPFIFLSALADRENILEGMSSGCDDYLTKPIDFEMLLAKIETRLRQMERLTHKKQQEQLLLYKAMQKKFASAPNQASTPNQESQPELATPQASIALVSSENKALLALQKLLEQQNYKVEIFTSGRAYLRKVKNLQPDITCFSMKTDDFGLNQMLDRCTKEAGACFVIVPSTGVKSLKFMLSDAQRNKLENIIIIPSKNEDILQKIANGLKHKN